MKETTAATIVANMTICQFFVSASGKGVMKRLKYLQPTGREHRGDADHEGKFSGGGTAQPEQQSEQDGGA